MVNKAILLGNLGADPEVRYTPSGSAVANFNIATSESWKDKETGEKMEKTEWHRIVAWNRLGEVCGEYLTKGSKVYIEGKLQTRQWEDRDGAKRYTTEVIAQVMKMLGGGGPSQSNQRSGGQRQQVSGNEGQQYNTGNYPGPDDDDIPF